MLNLVVRKATGMFKGLRVRTCVLPTDCACGPPPYAARKSALFVGVAAKLKILSGLSM
jgi:hypothetical protein